MAPEIPTLLIELLISALLAAVFAWLVISVPGNAVQTWVRRLFLLTVNLNPLSFGTWRREFSKRETFFAAWFLVFVVTFLTLLVHPNYLEGFK